ncbi:hypothetical protein [Rickettsiella grylli]|uniref:Calcium/calmodulin dependent protein kinase II, association-domain protein n=1 Tax=Rickettsiella grylli TaxID=59196 RepID=A8PNU3_9COXI|nr:hypothetical protein [Rickettsiella grylli]EDP46777.1 calcium/calmodulin dependent protein kinase II, association-domain protein [Rickettsiella grylli]
MYRKMIIASFLLSCFSASTLAMSTNHMACVKTNKQTIAALFDRWNTSLKTRNPLKVDKNYTDNAILLATLSSKPRVTSIERIEYFKTFLSQHPIGKIDSRTIKIGCNKAIDSGLYTFTLKGKKKLHARYTFTYLWNGNKWLISSHHSSELPKNKK